MPVAERTYHFDLFRYQLLPLTQNVQSNLFDVHSVDELKLKKNQFFAEALVQIQTLQHRGIDVIHRVDVVEGDWFVLHIAARKTIERHRADFEREQIENWPHVIVVINNNTQAQTIAISRNPKAFTSSLVVAHLLRDNLQGTLLQYHLHLEIEAIFEQSAFWSVIERYSDRIVSITFELISPNMANISKALELDLAKINQNTNSHRTDLKLNSGEGSALSISPNDTLIASLVDYASAGGGDIAIRVKGLKKTIHTSQNIREVTVEEVDINNASAQTLAHLKDLFE